MTPATGTETAGRAAAALSLSIWRTFGEAVMPSSPVGLYWALALAAKLTVAAMAAANRTLFRFFMFFVFLWRAVPAGFCTLLRRRLPDPSRKFGVPTTKCGRIVRFCTTSYYSSSVRRQVNACCAQTKHMCWNVPSLKSVVMTP